jgi:hypothetical protein
MNGTGLLVDKKWLTVLHQLSLVCQHLGILLRMSVRQSKHKNREHDVQVRPVADCLNSRYGLPHNKTSLSIEEEWQKMHIGDMI